MPAMIKCTFVHITRNVLKLHTTVLESTSNIYRSVHLLKL